MDTQLLIEQTQIALQADLEALKQLGKPRDSREAVVEEFQRELASVAAIEDLPAFWQRPTLVERFADAHSMPPDATALRILSNPGGPAALALSHYRPAASRRERHMPPLHVPLPLLCADNDGRGVVATSLGSMKSGGMIRGALARFYGLAEVGFLWVPPADMRTYLAELGVPDFEPSRTERPPAAPEVGRNGYVPHLNLLGFKPPFDQPEWGQIAPRVLTSFQAVPIFVSPKLVTLAIPHGTPTAKRDELSNLFASSGQSVRFVFAAADTIRVLMGEVSTRAAQSRAAELSARIASGGRANDKVVEDIDVDGLEDALDDTAVPIVRTIFSVAIQKGASDIIILEHPERLIVRYRVNGAYETDPTHYAASSARQVISRIKMLAVGTTDLRARPYDGGILVTHRRAGETSIIKLRFSSLKVTTGEEITLRVIYAKEIPAFGSLGMPPVVETYMLKMSMSDRGLFVVTGPTGSGKSSTMASLIMCIDRERRRVITIESPVEYDLPGCTQTEIPEDMTDDKNAPNYVDVQSLVRNSLRRAFDVMLVGETRDSGTVHPLLQAAGTGHLVFTTLHTNSSTDVAMRLLGMEANPAMFAHAFRGALAQRLARLACPHCSPREKVTAELLGLHDIDPVALEGVSEVFSEEGPGCNLCSKGVVGRQAIFELCAIETKEDKRVLEEGVFALIQGKGVSLTTLLEERMAAKGLPSLRSSALQLVRENKISLLQFTKLTEAA